MNDETTTIQVLQFAYQRAEACLQSTDDGEAKREFALAKTAIEDAIMRFNRGVAKHIGVFEIADLELEQTPAPA